jgi:hypothetical protein
LARIDVAQAAKRSQPLAGSDVPAEALTEKLGLARDEMSTQRAIAALSPFKLECREISATGIDSEARPGDCG